MEEGKGEEGMCGLGFCCSQVLLPSCPGTMERGGSILFQKVPMSCVLVRQASCWKVKEGTGVVEEQLVSARAT